MIDLKGRRKAGSADSSPITYTATIRSIRFDVVGALARVGGHLESSRVMYWGLSMVVYEEETVGRGM